MKNETNPNSFFGFSGSCVLGSLYHLNKRTQIQNFINYSMPIPLNKLGEMTFCRPFKKRTQNEPISLYIDRCLPNNVCQNKAKLPQRVIPAQLAPFGMGAGIQDFVLCKTNPFPRIFNPKTRIAKKKSQNKTNRQAQPVIPAPEPESIAGRLPACRRGRDPGSSPG